jgi:YegS/Rv2252/BmrU family lipid kinase
MNQEISIHNQWLVIVNPNSGKRRGEKDWPEIAALLTEAGFEFTAFFTEHRGHAMAITKEQIQENGFRQIIVVGGDGTLNEVANGIFNQQVVATTDITVGMIMLGTGNDWGRMYNLREKYKKAVKTLRKNRLFVQDVGVVTYHDGEKEQRRYFVNMAGLGYDALVAEMTNHMKDKGGGGTFAYLLNLLKGLFRYHHAFLEVEIDGGIIYRGPVFSMSVGICKYNGGGMMQLPNAIPDDGMLDVTIFKKVTKLTVVRNLKKLYSGKFTGLPFVITGRGKTVRILSASQNHSFLETDGESLGHSPFHFEIIPSGFKVITGKKWNQSAGEDNGGAD